jgi:hypothetical protein
VDKPTYKPIGNVLSSFFEENLSAKAGKVSEFFKSWRNIAGERLSSHSRVVEVENGIVIVEAEHPSWIQLLQMRQEEMLCAIEKGWPELAVKGIAFRLRGDAPKRSSAGPFSPERPVIRDEEGPAETAAQGETPAEKAPIKDVRLAHAIDKLKETIASQRKPKKADPPPR